MSPKGVVDRALAEVNLLQEKANKAVDETWAVFDKHDADANSTTVANFQQALELAHISGVQLAWSNEVFELWLLLHFRAVKVGVAVGRKEIYQQLETAIKKHPTYSSFIYEHGDAAVIDCVQKIGNEQKAGERAFLLDEYCAAKSILESNPCTKVYLLVRRLRELIDWYAFETGV